MSNNGSRAIAKERGTGHFAWNRYKIIDKEFFFYGENKKDAIDQLKEVAQLEYMLVIAAKRIKELEDLVTKTLEVIRTEQENPEDAICDFITLKKEYQKALQNKI